MDIFDFGAVLELISKVISFLRFFIIQVNGLKTKFRQSVQFRGFGNSVMVGVLPKSQVKEDRVVAID